MDSSNNDSFGSFGVSGGTDGSGSIVSSGGGSGAGAPMGISSGSGGISSGGGPVVIGGGASKKGKKWIWAVILGVVFVAVAVGVAVVLMANRDAKEDKNVTSYVNEYLSLLLTGEKSETFNNEKLSFANISNGEQKNIYVIPRLYSILEEENTSYYNGLQSLLGEIKEGIKIGGYSEDKKNGLEFFVSDSEIMLSYYFVASVLAYTNSDYEYYFRNKTLDGFLSFYGYPFAETDNEMLSDFGYIIDELYQVKKKFYESVAKTGCMLSDGIDYACLGELDSDQINEIQERISWLVYVEGEQADQMLRLIIADAESIREMVDGGADE